MRSKDEIRAVIEGAFKPLQCVAEIFDYEDKLRFRVFSPRNEPVVTFPSLSFHDVSSDAALSSIIMQTRELAEEKGFALEPWHLQGARTS